MEILKQGNLELLKKTKLFKCWYCKCEFTADQTEYKYWGSWRNLQCYLTNCPTCGSAVYAEE
jgi:hypothetical protein